MAEPVQVIEIDGVEHDVSKFSEKVQNVLKVRAVWTDDLEAERIKVTKTEAALRQLDGELVELIKQELQA